MNKIIEILKVAREIPLSGEPGARGGELVVSVRRFSQAVNRLEVLRGINGSGDKLFGRLIRRFGPLNIRDGIHNFRFFEVPSQDQ